MKLPKIKLIEVVLGVMIASLLCFMLNDFMVKTKEKQENETSLLLQQTTTQAISLIEGNKNIVKSSSIIFPSVGDAYAMIYNEERNFSKQLYFGDSNEILDISIGQYSVNQAIPGIMKPLLVAGHNGTHFKALQNFEVGDIVGIDTSYGKYTYEVYETEIMKADDFDESQLQNEDDYLIMYTCYPFNVAVTENRFFVYAKKVTGPVIKEEGIWKE